VVLQSRRKVDAIASVHRNLHSGEITATINLADFLEELTTNLSSDTSQMVSVEMKLDFVEAKQDVAVPLGILVNELITNSIKHAMGADGHLKLYLELKRTGHNQVQVVYADSGQGLPFALTTNIKGHFGLRLIQLMASQLEADLHIEGSTWRFHFPLDTTPT
jgi:two-component sensor histidine kinase